MEAEALDTDAARKEMGVRENGIVAIVLIVAAVLARREEEICNLWTFEDGRLMTIGTRTRMVGRPEAKVLSKTTDTVGDEAEAEA